MKRLKQVHILPFLLLAAGISGLYSCTQEGFPGEDTDAIGNIGNDGNSTQPFSISVSDGGYAPAEPSTRAEENNYQTSFAAGDKIGVFAVKDGAIIADVNNLCLTAENNGGVIEWPIPANKTLPADATYYAYYPYQSPLTGTLPNPVAADATAATFFADVISRWTPSTDQSDYAKYTAQDLMIAKGTVSGNSLTFSMKHQMALAVLNLPKQYKYRLDTDNSYTWTASVTSGNGYPVGDVYHYLVKPNITVSGTCISSYNEEWSTTETISAGYYKKITIDGGKDGPILMKSYTLQMGDFYMKDSSGNAWLKNKNATLTDADKTSCLGIVMKVGRGTDEGGTGTATADANNWKDEDDYKLKDTDTPMTTIHGYVLALHDGNDANICTWGPMRTTIYTDDKSYILFCGYSNTQTIKKYATDNAKDLETDFPAAYYASDGYESKYPAPYNSSGWFFPSAGQCWYWFKNRDLLKLSMDKVSGDNWVPNQYVSSSERGGFLPESMVWGVYFDPSWKHIQCNMTKDYYHHVRSCLAF